MFIDYSQIRTDLKTLLVTNHNDIFNHIDEEVDFNRIDFGLMPLADVRLVREESQIRVGRDYQVSVTFEIEILTADLSSFLESCTLRADRVNVVKDTIRRNPRFSAIAESTILTGTEFSSAQDDNEGPFIASAVISLVVMVYAGS